MAKNTKCQKYWGVSITNPLYCITSPLPVSLPERPDLLLIPGHPAAFPLDQGKFMDAELLRELPYQKPFLFSVFSDILDQVGGFFGVSWVIIQRVQEFGEHISLSEA